MNAAIRANSRTLTLPVYPVCTVHWHLHSPAEALWEWPW